MKLKATLFFIFAAMQVVFSQQLVPINSYVTDSGDTVNIFPSNLRTISPPPSPQSCATTNNLVLPYNQNNGQRGIMFDITALSNITISCFDVNMATGTTGVSIYYKIGTHVGFTVTPGAWTLIGTTNVAGNGVNIPTYVPINVNVSVTAGCTVAFYITRTTANGAIINYTNGTAVGFVFASNADMQVKDGTGKDYPFGASFTPRRFNGTIYYNLNSSSAGVVTGPLSMCAGSTQTYTFTGNGWSNYVWTVPVGTTITSGQGTNTITILAGSTPGQICVTPSNACGNGPVTCLTVSLAPSPTSTSTSVNVSCFGGNNGSATINASPAGVYTYAWSPSGGTGQTATALSVGTYTVTATNSGGCATTQTVTITQPPIITATQSQVNLLCNSGNNGSATVNPAGGNPGYTYSWLPTGGTGATASGLGAGTYTCTITDANGCFITQSFTITSPPAITLTTSSTPSFCGSPNGSASVVAAGGTGAYTYLWSPSGGTAATETGLIGGAYAVTVTDANGCSSNATVNVVGASTPSAVITTSTNVLCFGGNNGNATVTPAGGNAPYTYSWSPTGGNNATGVGLIAGVYTITVTDNNGCTATDTVTITEPPVLTSTLTSANVLCNGGNSGNATITATGGNPGYTYSWSPSGGNAAFANGLSAQNYTCTITDANSCVTTSSVTITEPSLLTTTSSQIDELCSGGNNASATVTPAGGIPGYTYSWSPSGGSGTTASSLFVGSYTCTITDSNGCFITQSFVITEPATVVASQGSITNVACFGQPTGAINISQSGGVGPYTYAWLPNVSVSNSASGIPASSYQVTVTDANGCASTITVTITQPPLLTLSASASPSSVCSGTSVTISSTPSGGSPGYSVIWNPGNLVGNSQNILPSSSTTYSATVTDANGCTTNATTLVSVFPMPVAALSADILSGCNPVCVNFSDISSIASPGTITAWNWDFGDGNISTSKNPLHCYTTPGVYTVILNVKSADGCTSTITFVNYISVYMNPIAGFNVGPQPTTIFNPEIFFTDISTNASSWQWSFGDQQNSTSAVQNPSFTYLLPDCYTALLTVTSSDGCVDTISHPVCLDPDVSIYVPNAFTPNGDNKNEVFQPVGYGLDLDKYQMWIFDRWGNMIFSTTDFNIGWNGKKIGYSDTCEIDTYVWKIVVSDLAGTKHMLTGKVNLVR